ncbi:2-amino-4-hydroxy-6-hydroxymethyldihydropteridine diphosphokinase [Pararhodonellum marinum]|uniref:2-amino-4-hydroxy-6- hydroxymethyldihydropteridine diphosphokinase n=1 Tax=Pararhodonellum marinum TaxID=2755358 RepID=UPI0018908428|nr:2-amino-4-hydroxy-6-hydroxymethyldihydropteridine diphosphokinase [Pararhodonellum marinum]
MKEVVFLIGGNLGDRLNYLERTRNRLAMEFEWVDSSRIFETSPWGGQSEGLFLNQAILVRTTFSADQVLEIIQKIEKEMGRKRVLRWGNRTMDIDIIFFGQEIINDPHLTIPHKSMAERRFVLEPLCDLIPDFVHPILGLKVSALLEECKDDAQVHPIF